MSSIHDHQLQSLSELGRRLFGTKPERDPGGTRTHVFGDQQETQRVAITQESEDEELKQFTRGLFNPNCEETQR